ncbi:MAG: tRNA-binding protein [Candidatus Diapherotrites archaeon]|nr:tRNA-binding protein [Candidatus Diapherotrites archaeon]
MGETISFGEFEKIEIRAGKIVRVEDFPEAKKPAFRLWIDFGALGIKKSSAQITKNYSKEALLGKQIIAVTNFPKKNIAGFESEVLVLGIVDSKKGVVLVKPDQEVGLGERLW